MASSNASQFPDAPEKRLAYDGHKYTKEEFQEFYGKDRGARYFAIAGLTRDAAKLCSTSKGLAANTITRDAAQLPAGSASRRQSDAEALIPRLKLAGRSAGSASADASQLGGKSAATV